MGAQSVADQLFDLINEYLSEAPISNGYVAKDHLIPSGGSLTNPLYMLEFKKDDHLIILTINDCPDGMSQLFYRGGGKFEFILIKRDPNPN